MVLVGTMVVGENFKVGTIVVEVTKVKTATKPKDLQVKVNY